MTRKFNIGRQNDIALNKEMHEQYITNGNYSADIIKNQTVLRGSKAVADSKNYIH